MKAVLLLFALVLGAAAGLLNRGITRLALKKGMRLSGFLILYPAHLVVLLLCLVIVYFAARIAAQGYPGPMAVSVLAQLAVIVLFTLRDRRNQGKDE